MRPHVQNGGFTLIELLVVIGIIGLLSAALLSSLAAGRRASQQMVDQLNLKWHFTQLLTFERQFGHFPRESGPDFVLAPWVYGIVEHTKANRDRYFSAALGNDDWMLEIKSRPVDEIWKDFDEINSEDTHFAGLGKGRRRHMHSGKQPLMCTDNEGGNTYLDGLVLVLMGDGTVERMPRIPDQLRYGAPSDPDVEFTMPIGEDSPHPVLARMEK